MTAFDRIFHPEFRWHIAVTEYGDSQMRPLHSNLLRGMNLPWQKSIYDKADTIAYVPPLPHLRGSPLA